MIGSISSDVIVHIFIFVLFTRTNFSVLFPVLFFRTFSKVATFDIQRFKISVSCFYSTCRYITRGKKYGKKKYRKKKVREKIHEKMYREKSTGRKVRE
jgi:hypothetical protein